jgi:hypothetical protein
MRCDDARWSPGKIFAKRLPVKYWEIIADNLRKAGWSEVCV